MAESYSILLSGLEPYDENIAAIHFSKLGHRIFTARNSAETREKLKAQTVHIIYFQPSSRERMVHEIEEITKLDPSLSILLVCARPTEGLVLDAWHAGAADIVFLPLSSQSLETSLQRASRQIAIYASMRASAQAAHANQARFFYLNEHGEECWASISSPRFTIGRSSGNSLILSQMGISRSHAEVIMQHGEYLLRDLGSRQGTYLNDVKVEQVKLASGDRIQLGGLQGTSLVFHAGDLLQSLLGDSDSGSEINLSVHGFKEVGMLFAAFRALSSTPVLDDLLALVVDTAIELTGADRGFIMLKDEKEELSFRCARNNQKLTLDGSCFQTSRRVPYDVFKRGCSIVIDDLDLGDQPEDHSATRRLGLRSISCVPLRYIAVHDAMNHSSLGVAETIGVLYVDSSNASAGQSNTRMDALETLATEAAMAIYNARLYKDSQDKRRMEEQLAIAREIQQALLPQPDKDLAYIRARSQNLPCHEVGGDYFDYFDLENGRFGFAVGDVSGKGMPAALLASLIQGLLSAQTLVDIPLPVMISNINRNLVQRGTGSRFITFFFGIIDADGICTYINAGHNPPFLLSRDGSIKELTEGGMVLGLFAGARYEAASVKLQPDDHLVLFTDGVIEALNNAGEEFGMERLVSLMHANAHATAPEILARLREAVIAFSADTPQHDDITIMVLDFLKSS
jgi:phosphoserine phosphatase RsbU/P